MIKIKKAFPIRPLLRLYGKNDSNNQELESEIFDIINNENKEVQTAKLRCLIEKVKCSISFEWHEKYTALQTKCYNYQNELIDISNRWHETYLNQQKEWIEKHRDLQKEILKISEKGLNLSEIEEKLDEIKNSVDDMKVDRKFNFKGRIEVSNEDDEDDEDDD